MPLKRPTSWNLPPGTAPGFTELAWTWWGVIVAINAINIGAALWCFQQSREGPDGNTAYMRRMRLMGLIFATVAFYRAIFVSLYLYQYAWFDTIANSSLLIRMLAWSAELSFSALIAFAMLQFNKDLPDRHPSSNALVSFIKTKSPWVLILCLLLAQFFATGGLITKSRLLFAIEESLWGLAFLSILPLAWIQLRRVFAASDEAQRQQISMLKSFAVVNFTWCATYCTYALIYHLPTEYWGSALEQLRTGVPELKTGMQAVADALLIVNVTHDMSDWGLGFVFWHSAYFTVCVWIAIFLMRGPRIKV